MNEQRDPLVVGAKAIAQAIGVKPRQVHGMAKHGLPVGTVPGLGWAIRQSALDKWIDDQIAGGDHA